MFSLRSWPTLAAAATFLSLVPAAGAGASPAELPTPISASVAYAQLAQLTVADPRSMAGYSRARFPHWAQQGRSCDTREIVLARDGADVKQDESCRAISGTWHSEYDGKDFTNASELDIDHMVPLAQAWRSGANEWTDTRRRQFANDLEGPQLVAVSASSNRSKGDQSPDQWRPPLRSYWCTYSRAWIDVKSRYELTVTEAERDALGEMVGTCYEASGE
ncbi:HNH endonuclease [Nonomuraea sp. MG754425]|uniref:HNH endonuclease family protein n=1 Tax=Nonomuraea sp. MG754425 TaxID=2570319 RepID=UPI001F2AB0AD|nr:HNH endonuclease family protein [Nonomuraea sp. MG754425]MCF6469202.1 HNH endonuclease [Nonomuraea sp. MG754425]